MKQVIYYMLFCLIGIVSYIFFSREQMTKQYPSVVISQNAIDSLHNDSTEAYTNGIEYAVISSSNNSFPYVNVAFSDTLFVPYLLTKKATPAISIIPISKTLINVGEEELLSMDMFRIFTAFPVVVDWKENQVGDTEIFQTKDEKNRFFVEHHYLYYCGRQVLSNNFDSYFFKVVGNAEKDECPTILRTLYLVNVKQDSIMSVSEFCSYSWFAEYEAYHSTTFDKKGKYKNFRTWNRILDSGDLYCEEDSVFFAFDSVGRIDCSN